MSTKYNDLIDLVRDWSNRDSNVLSESIIKSTLRYAADTAYRLLEIPPLETTTYFIASESGALPAFTGTLYPNAVGAKLVDGVNSQSQLQVQIPSDTVSFIFVRVVGKAARDTSGRVIFGADGAPTVQSASHSLSFNEKMDVRTFHDTSNGNVSANYWTRQGSHLLLNGCIEEDSVVELHYYGRLDALNTTNELPYGLTKAEAEASPDLYTTIDDTAFSALSSEDKEIYEKVDDVYVTSTVEKYNWLRDENQQILLYGALHRVFDYLQEEDQSSKYNQRFLIEIDKLNREEKVREVSGGNIKINFSGHGHI